MKSFVTAAREENADQDVLHPFQLVSSDEKGVEQFEAMAPTESQIAIFAASFATDAPDKDRMGAVLEFLRGAVEKTSFSRIRERLLDRKDPLDFSVLVDISGWLMELTTDFPTQPSSDSTKSPVSTGGRSTGRAPSKASTRSSSALAASAT